MEKEIKRGRKKKEIDGDFAKLLSELLQEVKAENGIIQDDVAKSIGVSRQALGKWANGETVPDILDLKKLAKYFNVSADYLLGLTGNPTTDTDLKAVCDYTGLSDKAINKLVEKMDGKTVFSHILDDVLCDNFFYDIIFELQALSENNIDYAYYYLMIRFFITDENKSDEEIKTMYTFVEDIDTKCDVKKYNISKLTEKISENYDLRKLYEEMNTATLVKTVCNYYNITEEKLKEEYKKNEYIVEEGIKARYLQYHRKQQTLIHEIEVCRKSNDINVTEVEDNGKHNPPKE